MRIAKYWAKGQHTLPTIDGQSASFSCWDWSDRSWEDAQGQAEQRARRMAGAILSGQHLNRYAYGDRPIREEVVESVTSGPKELGVITRNGYGALVLNAARAMFIDIDFKPEPEPRPASSSQPAAPESEHLPVIEQWLRRQPGLGLRVYRTAGGLRCLITTQTFDPTHPSTLDLMRSLNADPLYVTLCKQQESFRARLTPKPWRCGSDQPPSRYPFESPEQEGQYRAWQAGYQQVSAGYAVCRLIARYGDDRPHPEIAPILTLHDRYCCGISLNQELA